MANKVMVAFKQRRCFSLKIRRGTRETIKVLVAFKQRRCFSQMVSRLIRVEAVVLVAFKQRRCFSQCVSRTGTLSRGVGRFQTAKVFQLESISSGVLYGVLVAFKQRRCFSSGCGSIHRGSERVLVAFKQRRCFSPRCWSFQTAKVFQPYLRNVLITRGFCMAFL